jgi:thymidylate synthase (FAD)
MANVEDVLNDSSYIRVHDRGFVGLIDHMGDDSSICQAARVSYGKGTKSVSDDRGLIRYLLRHKHTTPFEMCEVKFHIKLPIFVMRQLIRHRTASVNEYSGRYSEMSNEFYIPEAKYLQAQSTTNKQGRAGEFVAVHKHGILGRMDNVIRHAYAVYKELITPATELVGSPSPGSNSFAGLAKELARIVLPVANYTECYWKIDLHNLFNMLRLRLDPHAQKEIVDFAEAIYKLVQPLYPVACEAFEDYVRQAKTFSRMELEIIKILLNLGEPLTSSEQSDIIRDRAAFLGMSKRETDEFVEWMNESV